MHDKVCRVIAIVGSIAQCTFSAALVQAQVSLPQNYGAAGTPQQIRANAEYLASIGDFLVDKSFSRAVAAQRTQNAPLIWVATYFERKELNRAYRLRTNPPFLDKEGHRKRQKERRIEEDPDLLLRGDVTDELNFLLRELASLSSVLQLMPGPDSLAGTPLDQPLEAGDAHHLRLTDGGRKGGQVLVFRADTADVQETRWPRVLRRAEFDDVRGRFERARDRAVQQIGKDGTLGRETEESLMLATDQLCDAFNAAYRTKDHTKSSGAFSVYSAGRHFLQSLAASVYRLIETNDSRLFDGSYRFQGETTVELLHHMSRFGLQFAPPEPGDEGTYEKLFFAVRAIHIYLKSYDSPGGMGR